MYNEINKVPLIAGSHSSESRFSKQERKASPKPRGTICRDAGGGGWAALPPRPPRPPRPRLFFPKNFLTGIIAPFCPSSPGPHTST